jgi:hypothetical protein
VWVRECLFAGMGHGHPYWVSSGTRARMQPPKRKREKMDMENSMMFVAGEFCGEGELRPNDLHWDGTQGYVRDANPEMPCAVQLKRCGFKVLKIFS